MEEVAGEAIHGESGSFCSESMLPVGWKPVTVYKIAVCKCGYFGLKSLYLAYPTPVQNLCISFILLRQRSP